jgi:hypothetical protein
MHFLQSIHGSKHHLMASVATNFSQVTENKKNVLFINNILHSQYWWSEYKNRQGIMYKKPKSGRPG